MTANRFDGRLVLPPEFWLLFRQRALIGGFLLAGLLLGATVAALRPDHYDASASLMIENRRLVLGGDGAVLSESALTDGLIDSQIEELRSDLLGARVVEAMGLADDPEFARQSPSALQRLRAALGLGATPSFDQAARGRAALRSYKEKLTVGRVGMSYVAALRFRSDDPGKSAAVLERLIEEYRTARTAANDRAAQNATAWLRDRARIAGPTASVLTPPVPPAFPSGLGSGPIVVAFGALGLIAGLGAALVRSLADRRTRTPAELAARLGIACFGALPATQARPAAHAALDPRERTFAAPLEIAAGALLTRTGAAGVVGVVSAAPREGKTCVAVNLAGLLAQATSRRTLLVDAGGGGSAPLVQATGVSGVIEDVLPGVDMLRFDPAAAGIAPLAFWRGAAPAALAEARGRYAAVVLDLPAASASGDLRQAAPLVDAFVLVAAEDLSGDDALTALSELPELRDRLRGAILNRRPAAPGRLARLRARLRSGAAASEGARPATPAAKLGPRLADAAAKAARRAAMGLAFAALAAGSGREAAAETYRLAPNDRVQVQVFEFPQASGDFTVDGDGAIAVPMLGAVPAAGSTAAEVAEAVAERLRGVNGLVAAPLATVRVVEYRPIYVLGEVERPGVYPYAPQMSVIEALALAGGAYRSDAGQLRAAITDLGEIDSLEDQRTRTTLQLARLRAELSEAETVAYPPQAASSADERLLASLVAQEDTLFRLRRDMMNERLAALSRLRDLYAGEIETIERQVALKRRQIETYALERERLGRSTAPSARALELDRAQAEAESQLLELAALQQRAQQMLAQAEQDAAIVKGGRRSEAAADFNAASAALAQIDTDLATARRRLAQFPDADAAASAALAFSILRRDAAGILRRSAVDETAALAPGDVLQIARTLGPAATN